MDAIYFYLLKASLALILFYGFYRLIIFQNTFFKVRRFTLLVILAFSAIFPLLRFTITRSSDRVLPVFDDRMADVFTLPEIIVGTTAPTSIALSEILVAIYALVVVFFLLRILTGVISIVWLRKKASLIEYKGVALLALPDTEAPFSFFGWVFFDPTRKEAPEADQILLHELTHVRQLHSFDSLISEIFVAFFWFNPFAWLLKQEVRVNLELLADEKVIRSGVEAKSYQYALLRLCHPVKTNKLVNNFNVSQFKRRIIMMDKNRSSRNSLLRYAFLLPIALGLVIACNSKEEELSDKPTVAVTSMKDQVKDVANEVFTVVEEMPEYPGGTNELLAYISKNIKYPEAAEKAGVEGRVICSFVVTKEGKVADVNVVRGVSPELDDEAIRVISSMPTWKPGKQKGEVVNVKYTLPIMFRLQGGSTETGSGDQVKEKVTEKSL